MFVYNTEKAAIGGGAVTLTIIRTAAGYGGLVAMAGIMIYIGYKSSWTRTTIINELTEELHNIISGNYYFIAALETASINTFAQLGTKAIEKAIKNGW